MKEVFRNLLKTVKESLKLNHIQIIEWPFNNIKIYYDIREKAAGGTGPMIETYSYPSFLEMMDPDEKQ